MSVTPVSLLDRLRQQPLHEDWTRLVSLYQPFIEQFVRLEPAFRADAEDICQEVMKKVVEHLPTFRRERDGSFRTWLKTITVNEVNQFWRKRQRRRDLDGRDGGFGWDSLSDPKNELSQLWDQEHDGHVLRRLLQLVESEFSPTTWRAFCLRVLEERPTEEVAVFVGISKNAVDIAKSRVLNRLRREAAGLIEE
jgi:RNA polymerase sigma-70 factor, ECF subfamily